MGIVEKGIVEIAGLRKSFGANEVLKGIDLTVAPGEVIAIIGKSGSGKSTLLRCINGLEVFNQGTLSVDGNPLLHDDKAAMRTLRQRVGMIFQGFNLFPHLSVGRNVMLATTLPPPSRRRSCSRASARPRSSTRSRISYPAASSSAWRSRVRWRWSPPCCCATRSPRRSIRSWSARCCASSSHSPSKA